MCVYGETPLSVWNHLARQVPIVKNDIIWELGSGRGKGLFWLNRWVGCRAIGVESNPVFYLGCKILRAFFGRKNIHFIRGDFFQTDFSSATVIYLYGTTLQEEEIFALSEKMESLAVGTRVITISFSLTEFSPEKWHLQKTLQTRFPWGMTDAFIQVKK